MPAHRQSPSSPPGRHAAWKLQDAKAHFSQLVREAQRNGPQHITVHGKDAVVVVSAADYARIAPVTDKPRLSKLLAHSPLQDLEFEHESFRFPVRDVEL